MDEVGTTSDRLVNRRDEHNRRITDKLGRELGTDICALLDDPDVSEIMLNPDGKLWVERFSAPMQQFGSMSAAQAESLMGTVASSFKTQITEENPILECELPLGKARFEALIPPIVSGPSFSIRKHAIRVYTLFDYVNHGIMTEAQRIAIEASVAQRKNFMVVGGTGSGKTTLTNAIIRCMVDVSPEHRIVILEDTCELQCTADNYVSMRATKHVSMQKLLKATMRMRPDRIIVGEVRDGAALAMLKAWNTGHPGGVATLHANSAIAGLTRLEQLIGESSALPMQTLIAEAVDLIVFIEKLHGGRRVKEVIRVDRYDGRQYITHKL